MKFLLILSIILNFTLIFFGGYLVYKKGGITYLKNLFESSSENDFDVHYQTKKSIFKTLPKNESDIVFVGNSITEFCNWSELLQNNNIKNRGISGDLINGVTTRIEEILISKPKKLFLLIGTNDLAKQKEISRIIYEYEKLILLIRKKSSNTKIYIQSLTPTFNTSLSNRTSNKKIMTLNKKLKKLSTKYSLTFIDHFFILKTNKNELNRNYSLDGLHLNGNGYQAIKNELLKYVNE